MAGETSTLMRTWTEAALNAATVTPSKSEMRPCGLGPDSRIRHAERGPITSPVFREFLEFVGNGPTARGAREWVIPYLLLQDLPITGILVRWLLPAR